MILSLLVGISIIAALFWFVDMTEVWVIMRRVSPSWLVASFIASGVAYIIIGLKWKIIVMPIRPVSLRTLTSLSVLSNFGTTLIGMRVEELLRPLLLRAKEQVPFATGLSSIFIDRLLDLLVILGLASVALVLFPENLASSGLIISALEVVAIVSFTALLLLFLAAWREKQVLTIVNGVVSWVPLVGVRLRGQVKYLVEGAKTMGSNPRLALAALLTLALWSIRLINYYFYFGAVGVTVPFQVVILGGAIHTLSTALPATPARLGTHEIFWTVAFVALGLDSNQALSAALLHHIFGLVFLTVFALASATLLNLSLKEVLSPSKASQPNEQSILPERT